MLFGFGPWALPSTVLLDLLLARDALDLILAPGEGLGSWGMIKPSTWLFPVGFFDTSLIFY